MVLAFWNAPHTAVERVGAVLADIMVPHVENVVGTVSGIAGTASARNRAERGVAAVGGVAVHLLLAVPVFEIPVHVACIYRHDRGNRHV